MAATTVLFSFIIKVTLKFYIVRFKLKFKNKRKYYQECESSTKQLVRKMQGTGVTLHFRVGNN